MKSKIGTTLVVIYLVFFVLLLLVSGGVVGGEVYASFVAGLPWSLLVAVGIFSGTHPSSLLNFPGVGYILSIIPLILNGVVLYFVGLAITKIRQRVKGVV